MKSETIIAKDKRLTEKIEKKFLLMNFMKQFSA